MATLRQIISKPRLSKLKNFLSSNKLLSDYKLILEGKLDIQEQRKIAKFELGYDNLLNQAELKKILGWSNSLKIFSANEIPAIIQASFTSK